MSSLIERLAPARLGTNFRWLLGAYWTSNIGDGLAMAAGPLLVASQTSSPFLVALAALLERLPWLIFGLHAGALADRLDRRRMTILMDTMRAGVVGVLVVFIATGSVTIGIVLVAMFLVGLTEVFGDSAGATLMPMLVPKADLGLANARAMTAMITLNQLIGPPAGAFLFAAGHAVPFGAQAVCVLLGAVLISRIVLSPEHLPVPTETHVRRDIADGIRWLWGHDAIRTLALTIFAFNITWAAAWATLVLYAKDVLHTDALGYGLLITSSAVGGLIGTFGFGWLERKVALGTLMRVCLSLEVLMHLGFALNRSWVLAMAIMFGFGAYAFVWGTLSNTVRQRVVPLDFQGRVGSVYRVGLFGGLVVGQGLGGIIAQHWGLLAPFWFAFVGSALTLALIWRQLSHIAAADAAAVAGDDEAHP